MSKVTLHGFPISTYVRTSRMALEEKGVDYDIDPAPPNSPEQLTRQPWGKVPAFSHGDVKLFETLAITRYIDEAFDGPALQPSSAAERARMCQWISAFDSYMYRPMIDIVLQRLVVPQQGGTADESLVAESVPKAEKCLEVLNQGLADSTFLLGDKLTLADLYPAPVLNYLAVTPEGEKLLQKPAHVKRWQAMIEDRDSAKVAFEPAG